MRLYCPALVPFADDGPRSVWNSTAKGLGPEATSPMQTPDFPSLWFWRSSSLGFSI